MDGRGSSSASSKGNTDAARAAALAASVVNPHYESGALKWKINCQRCVYAYEMNRRGNGVYEAQPNIDGAFDRYDYYAYGGWRNVMEGQTVQKVGSPSRKKVMTNIDELTTKWGDGSRGIVKVQWKHGKSCHVFNFERINGKTRYFDAQVGKEININDYLAVAKPTKTEISRTDNLKFKREHLDNCVKRVK